MSFQTPQALQALHPDQRLLSPRRLHVFLTGLHRLLLRQHLCFLFAAPGKRRSNASKSTKLTIFSCQKKHVTKNFGHLICYF